MLPESQEPGANIQVHIGGSIRGMMIDGTGQLIYNKLLIRSRSAHAMGAWVIHRLAIFCRGQALVCK